MIKYIPILILCLITFSCNSFKGKYCTFPEETKCIEFKKGNNFEYNFWIDTGADKGCGEYEVTEDLVVLNFRPPPITDEPTVKIKKLDFTDKEDTIGVKNGIVHTRIKNLIKVICHDKITKEILKRGTIHYQGAYPLQFGTTKAFRNDTIFLDLNKVDFPLTLKFVFPDYLDHEIELKEKAQYEVLAELVSSQGYNITSGQKKYSKAVFFKKNPKAPWEGEQKIFIKQR